MLPQYKLFNVRDLKAPWFLCADTGDLPMLEPSAWVECFLLYPRGHTWEVLVAFKTGRGTSGGANGKSKRLSLI